MEVTEKDVTALMEIVAELTKNTIDRRIHFFPEEDVDIINKYFEANRRHRDADLAMTRAQLMLVGRSIHDEDVEEPYKVDWNSLGKELEEASFELMAIKPEYELAYSKREENIKFRDFYEIGYKIDRKLDRWVEVGEKYNEDMEEEDWG